MIQIRRCHRSHFVGFAVGDRHAHVVRHPVIVALLHQNLLVPHALAVGKRRVFEVVRLDEERPLAVPDLGFVADRRHGHFEGLVAGLTRRPRHRAVRGCTLAHVHAAADRLPVEADRHGLRLIQRRLHRDGGARLDLVRLRVFVRALRLDEGQSYRSVRHGA